MNAMTKAERSSLPKGPGGLLEPQPAPLTLMDRWILSRLAFAATCCNEGFESYNFPKVPFIYYVSTFRERWVQKHLLLLNFSTFVLTLGERGSGNDNFIFD